ncbi:hypothetical protein AB0F18_03015 [Streptomyces sp. NPDC029216]|uniref:hypothetical protein n=1 Tax=Streptomyces sp. NPDC029216 TaxID=3154701 RepID=UPI0033F8BD8F
MVWIAGSYAACALPATAGVPASATTPAARAPAVRRTALSFAPAFAVACDTDAAVVIPVSLLALGPALAHVRGALRGELRGDR